MAQLTPQVQKTLMYEQYTFADPSFLDRAVMVAGVDGGTSGDFGYTHADPAMDYAITNYVNGAHGYSEVRYFKNNTSIVPAGVTNVTIGSSNNNAGHGAKSLQHGGRPNKLYSPWRLRRLEQPQLRQHPCQHHEQQP